MALLAFVELPLSLASRILIVSTTCVVHFSLSMAATSHDISSVFLINN
jgi:hypothetical protein